MTPQIILTIYSLKKVLDDSDVAQFDTIFFKSKHTFICITLNAKSAAKSLLKDSIKTRHRMLLSQSIPHGCFVKTQKSLSHSHSLLPIGSQYFTP